MVLLPETVIEGAQIAADRFAKAIRDKPLTSPTGERQVTVSVGIADFPRFGSQKADDLVRAALRALERAQRRGPAHVAMAADGEATTAPAGG